VEVVVEFEYAAEADDELTINVGDIITDVVRSCDGWYEGKLNGKRGLFPDNFVKVCLYKRFAFWRDKGKHFICGNQFFSHKL